MASFLQKSNPWIENTFTFAISFNPDTEEGFGNNRDTPNNKNNNNNNNNGEESDIFNSQYYNTEEREESSQYLQTENTIPDGLVGTPEKQKAVGGLVGGREEDELNGITKDVIEAPSRQSKIAQVISRGGNFNYYNNTTNNNEELNNNKKKASSSNKEENCPPYLIIHDGEYSTIAFLSPEVCAEYTNNNGKIPPNKSLISITHYTVSTIYQCCSTSFSSTETTTTNNSNNNNNNNNNTTHLQIIQNLQTNQRTIPQPYTSQIQNQIQNPKLYTCLYIQSSIIVIGAENQGLINNPIDVHCSVLLRRCLIAHEMQNGRIGSTGDDRQVGQGEGGGNANEEDLEEREEKEEHSHNVLITRLEAVHLHYQDLAEKKFHDEQHELNQLHPVQQQQQQDLGGLTAPESPSSPTTSSLASNSPATTSPHNNNNHTKKTKKKQYGRRRNNKKQQQQVGKKDSPYKRIGVSVVIPPEWPWLSRLVEQEQEGGKEVGNNCLIKEEPVDENEIQKRINMNSNGQQEQEQEVNGELEDVVQSVQEEGENDKVIEGGEDNDDNTKETDAAAAVLPLEKDDQRRSSNKPPAARSIGNVIELFDNFDDIEEVLDLTELDDDDDDDNTVATAMGGGTNTKTVDKKASIGMPKDDNEGDETTTSPVSRGNNNTVSFVGIDDMLVDDDDDDSEDDDNQLFTQPPDYVEEEGGGGFSQIPMALKRRGSPKARFKKMNQNDEQQIVESQVPLPLTRKVASEKSPRRKHSLDEEDEDEFPQSQIPLPSRRASKKSVPPSELNDDEEDDGILYQESQIPLPTKKKKESPLPTKKSKRWRKNMQEEETVPRSLRKQPPETLGQMNVSGNDRRQSQIPLPTRKRVSNERQVAAKEEDDRRQSQIPLPTRKKKIHGHGKGQASRFSLQSNHYKSSRQHPRYSESEEEEEEEEEEDADGRIEMSQVPINTKKQSTRRKSPLKPKPKVDDYSSDASSDGWMQIRRTAKPKIKSKKSRSSLQSNHFGRKFNASLERVGKMKSNSSRSKAQPPAKRTKYEDSDDDSEDEQSQSRMAAGEGSEESLPPRKRLRGDDEVLDSKNDPTVQNSTVASKAKAILGTSPPISSRTKQSNDDGLSLEGFKIVKNKKRKGNFDMSSFLENTKKFAWL